jgi:F-type H+-transporting ATPase subunit delta
VTSKTAAIRYARALFDVGAAEGANLEEIGHQLSQFCDLFAQNPALGKVLLNPAVPAPRKRAAVVEIAGRARLTAPLAKLLALLAERDRLVLLPNLLAAYRQRLLEHQHVVHAEVTTASPVAAERTQEIERSLARTTGRKVTLATRVDPSLIGGLVTRIGSTVYDSSIARQLEKMKERLEQG